MTYDHLLVRTEGRVGRIQINRPKARNALSSALMRELGQALEAFDAEPQIGAIVLTGDERAFAAGADIREMADKTYPAIYLEDFITRDWEHASHCRKPLIAAVAGFALGGGCELAMMCDLIIAADTAQFGQPEINLGIIPGAGGTQRLIRAVGKAKAMDLCLSGRFMDAQEAERSGLVARVVPAAELDEAAMECAKQIAEKSLPSVLAAKECVNRAAETTLGEGLRFERRQFHALFASEDQTEGMRAFMEKRKPDWKHR